MKAIVVKELIKTYPGLTAVDGISFEVEKGEIFGVVGPNGAGKTTTIECLEGLRKPDSGDIQVMGTDAIKAPDRMQEQIGVQLQSTALYDHMKVSEALALFSSLYKKKIDWGSNWAKLIEPLELTEKIDKYYSTLSGGQKQRLHIALALVHDPEVIFLDELTTGLDPQARRNMWELLESIRDRGKTIFLTTHYMEEAQHLCDRVAIFDRGKIIAIDSPDGLIAQLGANNRILFEIPADADSQQLVALPDVTRVEELKAQYVLYTQNTSETLMGLIKLAEEKGWSMDDLHVQRASLEDVFLGITGREIEA